MSSTQCSTLSGNTRLSTTPRSGTPSCANICRFISSSSNALPIPPLVTSTLGALVEDTAAAAAAHFLVELADSMRAQWAVAQLKKKWDTPFFLAVGLYAPHFSNYCPQKYFDLYKRDEIKLPPYKGGSLISSRL